MHVNGPIGLVIVQSTTYCNLDCSYCYLPGRAKRSVIAVETVHKIFERIRDCDFRGDTITVVWHAGEPTTLPIALYERYFAAIERVCAGQFSIRHSFQTNGTLVNRNWCEFFKRHNVQVGVSLDGPQSVHDASRTYRNGMGSHSNSLRGYRLLKECGLSPGIIAVATRNLISDPYGFHDFLLAEKATWLGLNVEEIEGIHTDSTLLNESNAEEWYQFVRALYRLTNESGITVREFDGLEAMFKSKGRTYDDQSHPFRIVSFSVNGDFSTFSPELLTTTHHGRDFVLGNVYDSSLETVLGTQKFISIRNEIEQGVGRCEAECEFFEFCGGGAPANKMSETGSFATTRTQYCYFRRQLLTSAVVDEMLATLN